MAIEELYPRYADKIAAAREEGYSDDEINRHLKSKVQEAIKEGYSEQEINEHLGRKPDPSWFATTADTAASALAAIPAGVATMFRGSRAAYKQGVEEAASRHGAAAERPKREGVLGAADRYFDTSNAAAESILNETSDYWGDVSKKFAPQFAGEFKENPSLKRTVSALVSGGTSLAIAIPLSVALGPEAGAAVLAGAESGDLYNQAIAAGKTPKEAFGLAMKAGIATALLEKYGLDAILGSTGGAVKRFVKGSVGESGTEVAQNTVQNIIAHHGYDNSVGYFDGIIESAIGGLVGGPAAVLAGDPQVRQQQVEDAAPQPVKPPAIPDAEVARQQALPTIQQEAAWAAEETRRRNLEAQQEEEQRSAPVQQQALDHSQVSASDGRIDDELKIMLTDPAVKPGVVMTKDAWSAYDEKQRAAGKKAGLRYVKQGDEYMAYHYETVRSMLGTKGASDTDAAVRAKMKSGQTGDILFGSMALTPGQGEVDTAVTKDGRVLTDPIGIAAENGQGNIATAAKLKADEVATIPQRQAEAVISSVPQQNSGPDGNIAVGVESATAGQFGSLTPTQMQFIASKVEESGSAEAAAAKYANDSAADRFARHVAQQIYGTDQRQQTTEPETKPAGTNSNGLHPKMAEALRIEADSIESAYSETLVIDGHKKEATVSVNRGVSPWFLDAGYKKAEVVSALRKAADGKKLTEKQKQIVSDGVDWTKRQAATRAEPVATGNLQVGDEFTGLAPDGQLDEFRVVADNGETKTIKDGVEFQVDSTFDEVPIVGQVNRAQTQPRPAQKSGADGKLFATPPTFGKKTKPEGANVSTLAMEDEQSIAQDDAKQVGMFDEARLSVAYDASDTIGISKERIEKAFPGAKVLYSPKKNEAVVYLPNGRRIKILFNQEIVLAEKSATKASRDYGKKLTAGTRATGAWVRINRNGIIGLAKWAGGSTVDHEALHAAFDLVLTSKEKAAVIKKYGSEEKAAAAYQKWDGYDDSLFGKIKGFFTRVAELFTGKSSDTVFKEIRSGAVWARKDGGVEGGPAKYSIDTEGAASEIDLDKVIAGPESLEDGFLSRDTFENAVESLKLSIDPNGNVDTVKQKDDIGLGRVMAGTPSRIAEVFKQLRYYVELGKAAVHKQDRLRGMFDKKLIEVMKMVPKANREAFFNLLWMGDANETEFSVDELRDMQQQGNAEITDDVINAYRALRKFHNQVWRTMSLHRKKFGLSTGYREGHIPHLFENWNVHEMVEQVDANGDKQIVSAGIVPGGTHRSMKDAARFANGLDPSRRYQIRPKTFSMPDELIAKTVLKNGSVLKLEKMIEDVFALTRDEAQEFSNEIARRQGRHRQFGNLMQRTGSKGYRTDDLPKILTAYYRSVARYLALDDFKSKVVPKFEKDFKVLLGNARQVKEGGNVARYAERYIQDVLGVPGAIESLMDATLQRYFGENLRSQRPAIWYINKVLHATSVLKLGMFNVTSAAVNTCQLINTFSKVPVKHFTWAVSQAVRPSSAKVRAIMRRSGIEFDLGVEDTGGYSATQKGGKIVKASLYFFSKAEYMNRKITALASYRWAKHDFGYSDRQALDFSRMMVDLTQFDYSVADTAQMFRNPIGRLLGQFRPYAMKQLGFITGLKGADEWTKFMVPTLLFGGIMGIPMVEGAATVYQRIAGPFVGWLLDAAMNDDDDDDETKDKERRLKQFARGNPVTEVKRFLMEWAGDDTKKQRVAETAMYGVLSQVGVDFSRRTGLGDMIPTRASDLLGPTINTILQTAGMAEKDGTETLRAVAPALGNLLTAIETTLDDGRVSDPYNRESLKYIATTRDIIVKAVGGRPLIEAKISDINRVNDYDQRSFQAMSQEIADRFVDAEARGERERAFEIIKDGQERIEARFGKGYAVSSESFRAAYKNRITPEATRRIERSSGPDKLKQMQYNKFLGDDDVRIYPLKKGDK